MTHLGGGVDELEVDLLHSDSAGVGEERFSQSNCSLFASHAAALDHDEIRLDQTVVNESSDWVDGLIGDVDFGSCVVFDQFSIYGMLAGANSVDLLVDFRSVVVSLLTGSGNRESHSRRMPGSDTGNLSQTLVSLSRQLFGMPSGSHSVVTSTSGDTNAIDHLVLSKHRVDVHILLEVFSGPVDLLSNGTAVDLDFDQVRFFLSKRKTLHLGVADGSYRFCVLFDQVQVPFNSLLARIGFPLLGSSGEGFLLGSVPVLIESSAAFVTNMTSPDGLDGSWTVGSIDVPDNTDALEWRCFNDGNWFDDFLLVGS